MNIRAPQQCIWLHVFSCEHLITSPDDHWASHTSIDHQIVTLHSHIRIPYHFCSPFIKLPMNYLTFNVCTNITTKGSHTMNTAHVTSQCWSLKWCTSFSELAHTDPQGLTKWWWKKWFTTSRVIHKQSFTAFYLLSAIAIHNALIIICHNAPNVTFKMWANRWK